MFYRSEEFANVSKASIVISNLDIALNAIPIASTVTNVARIIFKVCYSVAWISLSGICGLGFLISGVISSLISSKDRPFQLALAYYRFINTSLIIQSLWMKTFFTAHYFEKSYSVCLLHAIPIIGNIIAVKFAEKNTYQANIQRWENRLKNWEITPKFDQSTPLFSCYYPTLVPSHLKNSKALILADCKLNPYHIKKIPSSYFSDIEFVKKLMRTLTYYHHGKTSYINRTDFEELLVFIIKEAKKFELLEEIELPLSGYLFDHDFGELLDLIKKYPDILWLIDRLDFIEHKKYIALLIHSCPHVIAIMSDHFLKLNKTLVMTSLTQDPFIATKLPVMILVFIFSSKENVLQDGVFLSCVKHVPTLKIAMQEYLDKKKQMKRLRFV